MPEPLWWSHPGYYAIECVFCGDLNATHYNIHNEDPLCTPCWEANK